MKITPARRDGKRLMGATYSLPHRFLDPFEPFWLEMLSTAMLKNLKREKPWAKLRMSRKEYETRQPWKNSGVSRTKFEEYVAHFPDEAIDVL